jgi:hypothetical protein
MLVQFLQKVMELVLVEVFRLLNIKGQVALIELEVSIVRFREGPQVVKAVFKDLRDLRFFIFQIHRSYS